MQPVDLNQLTARRRPRRSDPLRGTLLYHPELQAIVAVTGRFEGGWRCEVIARRHHHMLCRHINLADADVGAFPTTLPRSEGHVMPVWLSRMLWQAWTYQRWRGPRMRLLCRLLAEDLLTPGTLTADLHPGAVRRLVHHLHVRPAGLRHLLRSLVAAGALTPVGSARNDSWGRLALLAPTVEGTPPCATAHGPGTFSRQRRERRSRRRPMRRQLGMVAALMVASLAGCGDGQRTESAVAPTSATTTSTPVGVGRPSVPAVGAPSAMQAYRNLWKAYVAASRIPDPAYPALTHYADGDALEVFVNGLRMMRRNGLVGRGDVALHPRVTAVRYDARPPTVHIEDCADTGASRLVRRHGSSYEDTPGGRQAVNAVASRIQLGAWRITSFALFEVGSC
jgi:hypothetical protein